MMPWSSHPGGYRMSPENPTDLLAVQRRTLARAAAYDRLYQCVLDLPSVRRRGADVDAAVAATVGALQDWRDA